MSNKTTQADASRIQGGQAKGGGDMTSGGFASRAQSAGDTNANNAAASGGGGGGQNAGRNDGGNGGSGQGKK